MCAHHRSSVHPNFVKCMKTLLQCESARLQAAIPDLVLALFEAVQRAHDQEGESNSGSGRTCFSCLLVSPR